MSQTFSIICDDCKEHLWIAQGSADLSRGYVYQDKDKRQWEFYKKHIEHKLRFDFNDDLGDEYKEVEEEEVEYTDDSEESVKRANELINKAKGVVQPIIDKEKQLEDNNPSVLDSPTFNKVHVIEISKDQLKFIVRQLANLPGMQFIKVNDLNTILDNKLDDVVNSLWEKL